MPCRTYLQIRNEFRELVIFTEPINTVAESFPANDGREVAVLVTSVDFGHETSLQIHSPAFIQPEVLPASIAYEITRPGVGKFVSNDVHVLPIAGYQSRCCEGIHRILHAAVRKARRKNQNVVCSPSVGIHELLRGLPQHQFEYLELDLPLVSVRVYVPE